MADYEHGQWVLDGRGTMWRWDADEDTWCMANGGVRLIDGDPLHPLSPLFTAEQVQARERQARAEALRNMADEIDRGLAIPPFVLSALVRERAAEIEADGVTAGEADAEGGTADG